MDWMQETKAPKTASHDYTINEVTKVKFIRTSALLALAIAGVLITSAPVLAATSPYAPILGTWMGPLTVMGTQLRIAFNFSLADDGSLVATIDSVDQSVNDIPVDTATFEGGALKLTSSAIAAEY